MGVEPIQKLDRLDEELHNRLTHYRYNRNLRLDERYRKGRIAALKWLTALCRHYRQKAEGILPAVEQSLDAELAKIRWLDPSPYRQGIEDAVEEFRRLLGED
ncbi:hypothetical protein [Nitratifractor salsuginis]|uniref:Uncharacterized protein n=1 Tax=Nitratifractor salsuginis (strain DSM 16511 / JCM 12458 / E9I37-1) TaxID=749222 RepID=E6X350_NITSE|nr:hypothetical protein [Nitratifractor salsuginis]ADV46194.1 hypothetical protein Nitsa_0935 [Nitratifractor salsuginis DSM 16511]